jgi:transcriptional regulator with XRE-family HTH domain
MNRGELADFLRRRREELTPADVGLPSGRRRRTKGLRREEVAAGAQISTDYYTRLEQARGPHPSVPVLAGLARALRLDDDERDHLYHLADQAPPIRTTHGHVSPGVLHLLDKLDDVPAFVTDDLGRTMAQNRLAIVLFGDEGTTASHAWRWFTDPDLRHRRHPVEEHERLSRSIVDDLRATAARRQGDRDVDDLLTRLQASSQEFRELWAEHRVAVRRNDAKKVLHPEVGMVDLLCECLETAHGQQLVVLRPRPGTDAHEKLQLLAVIGTQSLSPSTKSG